MAARRRLGDLARARDALHAALERQADPWRVAELRARHDQLAEAAMAVEDEYDSALGPAPRMGRGGR